MFLHAGVCLRPVAADDRVDDVFVLGHRGAQGADAVERHAPQPQDVAVQPVELRCEQRVARRLRDRGVQLAVELDQGQVVARGERAARALDERAQRLALARSPARSAARRAASPSSSTRSSKISCRSAASSSATSVPRRGRITTRFSQASRRSALRTGREADAELGRERRLVDGRARRQLERHDALADAGVGDVAQRVGRGAAPLARGTRRGRARRARVGLPEAARD